jgi:hypothetical protein
MIPLYRVLNYSCVFVTKRRCKNSCSHHAQLLHRYKLCVILLVQPIYNQMVFSQLDQQTNSRISEIWEPSQSQIPKIPWSSPCTFTCDHTQVLLWIIFVVAGALNSSYINLFDHSHICDCSLAFSISLACVLSCIIALYPASCYIWANSIQWMPSLCKMGHETWQIIHLKGDTKTITTTQNWL